MMKHFLLSCITSFLLATSLPAFAITLDQAKDQGLVGERSDGYLSAIKKPSQSSITALIKGINNKRRAVYQQKANKAGVTIDVMQTRIAQRLKQRAKKGHYVQTHSGQWQQK